MSGERYSSAPSYPSVYGPEDFDDNGNIINLKEVPLGDYPTGVSGQVAVAGNQAEAAAEAFSGEVAPNAPKPTRPEPKQEFGTTTVKQSNLKCNFSKEDVGKPGPQPNEDPEDPRHWVAVLSYMENRHPEEDRVLAKYWRQWLAKKEGRYDPIEDPPVYLSEIVPKLVVKCSRTFSRDEYETEGFVEKYVRSLHARTDMTIVPVLCGRLQVFPVSDMARGKYHNEALEQTMRNFYDNQEKSASEIADKLEREQEIARETYEKQRELTRKERAGLIEPPEAPPSAEEELDEAQRKAREKQEEWRQKHGYTEEELQESFDKKKTGAEVTSPITSSTHWADVSDEEDGLQVDDDATIFAPPVNQQQQGNRRQRRAAAKKKKQEDKWKTVVAKKKKKKGKNTQNAKKAVEQFRKFAAN